MNSVTDITTGEVSPTIRAHSCYSWFLTLFFALTFSSNSFSQSLSGITICIDPGHGGNNPANDRELHPDPGVVFWESESNYQKALLLKPLLESAGATVILTRNTNSYPNDADEPSLSARVAVANANGVDWFHSIHSNAFNAATNYTLILVREKRSLTDPAASTGNGLGIPEQQASWDFASVLGPVIRNHLRTTGSNIRLDWSFYSPTMSLGVLRGLLMPGELSEGSFHDVPAETRRLLNNDYRKMEAYAIYKSFLAFNGAAADTLGIVAGLQRDKALLTPVNFTKVRLLPEDSVYSGDQFNNGFYMFDRLTPGPHILVFETPGYRPDTVYITATANGVLFLDHDIEPFGPPTILSSTPVDGDSLYAANLSVQIRFTKVMDTASVRSAFSVSPNVSGRLLWSGQNALLTFDPDSIVLPFNEWFTVTIDSTARSASGDTLDGDGDGIGNDSYHLTFRTKAVDAWPPAFYSRRPAVNDTLTSPLELLNLTFDEAVQHATVNTGSIALQLVGGSLQGRTFQVWTHGGRTGVNVNLTNGLVTGKSYRLRVSGLADLAGNAIPLEGAPLWDFSVAPDVYVRPVIENFDDGIDGWESPLTDEASAGFDPAGTTWQSAQDILSLAIPENSKAASLGYVWVDSAETTLIRLRSDSAFNNIHAARSRIQVYVWGDGSSNLVRFTYRRTTDADTVEHSPWQEVRWVGWRLIEHRLDVDSTGTPFATADSGGTVHLLSIDVSRGDTTSSLTGRLVFDNVQVTTEFITSVPEQPSFAPEAFVLSQNFPNPFNPSTTISYSVPRGGRVTVVLLDLLGRTVATLADRHHEAGSYNESIDLGGRATGTYIVELRSGDVRLHRKIMLLK